MISIEPLTRDLRYAVRALRRSPLFAGVAVSCLAIGIAASTTMFSVFDAIALRPLPFPEPRELFALSARNAASGRRAQIALETYALMERDPAPFSALAAYTGRRVAVTQGREPVLVSAQLVSPTLFPLLGVRPPLGRLLLAADDSAGSPPVALISDALWHAQFAGDRGIVGARIAIDHLPYTVVGVMPAGFKFPEMSDLWLPLSPAVPKARRASQGASVVARLGVDRDLRQATARLGALVNAQRRDASSGRDTAWTAAARPLGAAFVGSDERLVAAAMLGATAFLLLIACANVANLLLTRAVARHRETAVRAALGASRRRIAAQMTTEGLLLAGIACVVSLPLAWQALGWIQAAIPPSDPYPYFVHWSLDGRAFLYAATASVVTGTVFGLLPAMHVTRGRLADSLKEGTQGAGTGARGARVREGLVVAEVSLALVLLVGASLFVRTFVGLRRTDLGYDASRLMTMRVFLPGARYDSSAARTRFVEDLLRRVAAVPGVSAATVSDLIPLDDEGGSRGEAVADRSASGDVRTSIAFSGVAGAWFDTFGERLLAGRTFTERDWRDSVPVAVINARMAEGLWPNGSAIGRRFRIAADSSRTWFTVVGVTANIRVVKLDETEVEVPHAYLPFRFTPTRDYGVIVRTPLDAAAVASGTRAAIHAVDGAAPVFKVWSMDDVRYLSFWMYAVWGTIFAVFGGIALVLSAVGVYAVIFYSVAQRTHELGIRVALGARRADVVRLVLGKGLRLAGLGVVVGLIAALGLTGIVKSLLIGVSATDPLSFAGVAVVLFAIAAVASYVPAVRATRVDPLVALRAQ
jgi:predicted permease